MMAKCVGSPISTNTSSLVVAKLKRVNLSSMTASVAFLEAVVTEPQEASVHESKRQKIKVQYFALNIADKPQGIWSPPIHAR